MFYCTENDFLFLLVYVGLPGEKGERGSPGTGIRGQRGANGPQGNTIGSFLHFFSVKKAIIIESPVSMRDGTSIRFFVEHCSLAAADSLLVSHCCPTTLSLLSKSQFYSDSFFTLFVNFFPISLIKVTHSN